MTLAMSFDDLVDAVALDAVRTYGVAVESPLSEIREATERQDLVDRVRGAVAAAQRESVRLALATVLAGAPTHPEWQAAAREVLAEFADRERGEGPPEGDPPAAA